MIHTDFETDFYQIIKDQLAALHYDVAADPLNRELAHKYFNLRKRQIDPAPRQVFQAKEFTCPQELQPGLDALIRKIEAGEDLRPHQSRKLTDLNYDDTLLNDWGIQHLHLGMRLESDGFFSRTGPVLFGRFTPDSAYLINVMGHGSWSRQEMLRILYTNWPASLERYVMKGVIRMETHPTDDQIAKLRKANIVTILEIIPGVVIGPMGGGYSSSGISTEVVMQTDNYLRSIKTMENNLKTNIDHLIAQAREQGYDLSGDLRFKLLFDEAGKKLAYLPSHQISFEIN